MARKKTPKVHKSSYAERVLGALTQEQKTHRRQSVHMATLRARIRKNADEKKEPLGPQWSHFVTKAVHRLREEGIVGTSDQNVFLTPEGKTSISTAKRSARILADPEERAIRHVSGMVTSPRKATKRPISSTSTTGTEVGTHDDAPEGSGTSISTAGPASKRPRRSTVARFTSTTAASTRALRGNGRATAATTTSATPTRRPRGRPRKSTVAFAIPPVEGPPATPQTNATWFGGREMSPLTDVEDLDAEYAEENGRLRVQLRGRDDEISALRRRLEEISTNRGERRHAAPAPPARGLDNEGDSDDDADGELEERGTPSLLRTAASEKAALTTVTGQAPTSVEKAPLIRTQARQLVNAGLTRTQSGSIIPNISKQPTPAPSDAEGDDEGSEMPIQPPNTDIRDTWPSPSMIPTPPTTTGFDQVQSQLQSTRDLLYERVQEADDGLQKAKEAFADRIQTLENEVTEKSGEIDVLQVELEGVRQKEATARLELSSHASFISELQQAVQELQRAKKDLEEQVEVERGENSTLAGQITQTEKMYQIKLRELEESRTTLATLDTKTATYEDVISRLEQSLTDARDQLRAANDRYTQLEASSRGTDQELILVRASVLSSNDEVEKLRKEAVFGEQALEKATVELGKEKARCNKTEKELAATIEDLNRMRQDLSTKTSALEGMYIELGKKDDTVRELAKEVEIAKGKTTSLEQSLVSEETRHAQLEQQWKEAVAHLEEALEGERLAVDVERRQVTELEMEREEVKAQNVGLQAELSQLRIKVDAGEKEMNILELELTNRAGETATLREALVAYRDAKETSDRKFDSVQNLLMTLV